MYGHASIYWKFRTATWAFASEGKAKGLDILLQRRLHELLLVTSSALQSRKWQLIGNEPMVPERIMWPSIARANGQWCLRRGFKCNFSVVWPWPLTSWRQSRSFHLATSRRCQLAQSFHSFPKYRVHNKRKDGRMAARKHYASTQSWLRGGDTKISKVGQMLHITLHVYRPTLSLYTLQ